MQFIKHPHPTHTHTYPHPHRDAPVPDPPVGRKWGKVQHDNKVTWLASWTENIQGDVKYVMLNPTSRLKVGPLTKVAWV